MTQLERIEFIYKSLEENPKTIEDIYTKLLSVGFKIGRRQIYNDLKQLGLNYLRPNEILKIDSGRYNKKIYRLIKDSDNIELNYRDITTFQLTRTSAPRIINFGRANSMNKFKDVYKSFVTKNQTLYTFMNDHQNTRTNFFEALYDEKFNQKIDDVIWSIANEKLLIINEVYGDATSSAHLFKLPLIFRALQIIYHRGDYVVAGYEKNGKELIVINISSILKYEITTDSFYSKKILAECIIEMSKRFGVTTNIDKNIYKIKLQFSSVTGNFISNYFWHESQKFYKIENDNWILELHCGINRELVGWLFLWMSNVKVISPLKLKKMYLNQLTLINNGINNLNPLVYKNLYI